MKLTHLPKQKSVIIQNHHIMRNKLMALAIASVFAACGSKQDKVAESTALKTTPAVDSNAALNDKSQLIEAKGIPDTIVTTDGSKFARVQPGVSATTTAAPVTTHKAATPRATTHKSTHSSASNTSTASAGTGSSTTTTTTTTTTKKKGWSKAAKGTAIGAGAGAITGAIISKKKGKGAIIGGIIGAGGGYIIGRKEDKKDGRVQ